jgi:hypothetical protein
VRNTGCIVAVLILLLVAAAVGACGYYLTTTTHAEQREVEVEARAWLELYNAQRFAECYRRSDASLKVLASEEDYSGKLTLLFSTAGPVTLGPLRGFYVNTNQGLITATAQWQSASRLGSANAVFTLRRTDAWRVAAFLVRP